MCVCILVFGASVITRDDFIVLPTAWWLSHPFQTYYPLLSSNMAGWKIPELNGSF